MTRDTAALPLQVGRTVIVVETELRAVAKVTQTQAVRQPP